MGKNKKKRNKHYSGVGSTTTQSSVTRISAVNRNKPAQWWFDNKRLAKPILIASGVALAIIVIIYEIIKTFAAK